MGSPRMLTNNGSNQWICLLQMKMFSRQLICLLRVLSRVDKIFLLANSLKKLFQEIWERMWRWLLSLQFWMDSIRCLRRTITKLSIPLLMLWFQMIFQIHHQFLKYAHQMTLLSIFAFLLWWVKIDFLLKHKCLNLISYYPLMELVPKPFKLSKTISMVTMKTSRKVYSRSKDIWSLICFSESRKWMKKVTQHSEILDWRLLNNILRHIK